MIGSLAEVVLDCDDPRPLAAFSVELIGGQIVDSAPDWVGSETPNFRVSPDPAGHPFCLIDPQD